MTIMNLCLGVEHIMIELLIMEVDFLEHLGLDCARYVYIVIQMPSLLFARHNGKTIPIHVLILFS